MLAVLVAGACTKDIPYKGSGSNPVLAINCMAKVGEPVDVYVGRSRFFLDTWSGSNKLDDATVTVSINSVSQTPVYDYDRECYMDSRIPAPGDTITVTATHSDFGTATATEIVPVPSVIDKEKESVKSFPKTENWAWVKADSVWSLSVSIGPKQKGRHFYKLSLYPEYYLFSKADNSLISIMNCMYKETQSTKMALGLISQESILDIDGEDVFHYGVPTYTFSDEKLPDNGVLTFELALQRPIDDVFYGSVYDGINEIEYDWNSDVSHTVEYRCLFVLETISEEAYKYSVSAQQYYETGWSIFTDPVLVTSNIKGGLGILGTSSHSETLFTTYYTFE